MKALVLGVLLVPLVAAALWTVSDIVGALFLAGSFAFAYLMDEGVISWHA